MVDTYLFCSFQLGTWGVPSEIKQDFICWHLAEGLAIPQKDIIYPTKQIHQISWDSARTF